MISNRDRLLVLGSARRLTLACEPLLARRGVVVAAAERRLHVRRLGRAAVVSGEKRPFAAVLRYRGVTAAFDAEGDALDLADIERRRPELRERLDDRA